VAKYAPVACAGPLLMAELEALERVLRKPARPVVAIVGGSKVSTKLKVLKSLRGQVDQLIVGAALPTPSLRRRPRGRQVAVREGSGRGGAAPRRQGLPASIPVPTDVVVAKAVSPKAAAATRAVKQGGPRRPHPGHRAPYRDLYARLIARAGTIIWNGPVGVFEIDRSGVAPSDLPKLWRSRRPSAWLAAATPSPPSRSTA